MKKTGSISLWIVLSTLIYAQNSLEMEALAPNNTIQNSPSQNDVTTLLKLSYEALDFTNSKKKDDGKRVGIAIDYKDTNNLYQIVYEKTDTTTFKPALTKNLKVDKYYFKYTRKLNSLHSLNLSYGYIDDNLMRETTHGHIYGIGYSYSSFGFTQYLSDYKQFNVYQSEAKYSFKKSFDKLKTSLSVVGKYIHLQDKNSNNFSKNAKTNYFTTGVKLHTRYDDYHFKVGAFFGKRIFAVMNNGFKVQHHAMEFKNTYMCGIGKKFNNTDINLKYVYQKATEIPIHNKNVKVQNIILQVAYKF
jgi:hypothetical protein